MSRKKDEQAKQDAINQEIRRIRLPKGREVMGIIDKKLGGSRTRIRGVDGKDRVCRVPGRLKNRLWLREGDIVIVEPWEFGGDEKGDIVYKYRKLQVEYLKKSGYLEKLNEFEDF